MLCEWRVTNHAVHKTNHQTLGSLFDGLVVFSRAHIIFNYQKKVAGGAGARRLNFIFNNSVET